MYAHLLNSYMKKTLFTIQILCLTGILTIVKVAINNELLTMNETEYFKKEKSKYIQKL